MTPKEMRQIADQVVTILNDQGAVQPNTGGLAVEPNELECFTCSGRFRCRPSFIVKELASSS